MLTRAAATALLIAIPLLAATTEREEKRSFSLAPGGELVVDTSRGLLRISSWDQPRVDIQARVVAQEGSSDPEGSLRDVDLRMSQSGSTVRIETVRHPTPANWWGGNYRSARVEYEIKVPRRTALRVHDARSQVDIRGTEGPLDLKVERSTVRLQQINGPLQIDSERTSIDMHEIAITGPSRISAIRGDVVLGMQRNVGYQLVARLDRRTTIDGNAAFSFRDRSDQGHVTQTIHGGGPRLILEGERASFRLR